MHVGSSRELFTWVEAQCYARRAQHQGAVHVGSNGELSMCASTRELHAVHLGSRATSGSCARGL